MKNCGLDEDGHTHSYLLWLFYVTSIRNATETRGSRSRSAPAVTLRIDGDPGVITKEVCVALVGGGVTVRQIPTHSAAAAPTQKKKEKKLTFRSVLGPFFFFSVMIFSLTSCGAETRTSQRPMTSWT